ncbi:MAG: acyl-ACP--UDP-N-acetylglucosamine O-acyltransferase [Polyangiaceae bacterium]
MSRVIHPTAVVARSAELDDDVQVGPYAIVGAGVRIGKGTRVLPHAVVGERTRIGAACVLHPFSVTGGEPQDRRHRGGPAAVEIGDRVDVREHVTIHGATGDVPTTVGTGTLLMVGVHVAHDVSVGSHVTLANGVQLAGHVVVEDHVTMGGLAAVAQFVRVGESAFVAAGSMVERDVPPFVVVQGDRAKMRGINVVGLERREVGKESCRELRRAFRALVTTELPRREALDAFTSGDPYANRFARALAAALEAPPTGRARSKLHRA